MNSMIKKVSIVAAVLMLLVLVTSATADDCDWPPGTGPFNGPYHGGYLEISCDPLTGEITTIWKYQGHEFKWKGIPLIPWGSWGEDGIE